MQKYFLIDQLPVKGRGWNSGTNIGYIFETAK